jgi:UDP-3-O-[3-hydroxymyristoyl] glucosamine N-acyltransferase
LAYTLQEIAETVQGKVIGDDQIRITGVNAIDQAKEGEITFFADPRYKSALKDSSASALITGSEISGFQGAQVVVPNAVVAFATITGMFAPIPSAYRGISDQAVIAETARIGRNVTIHPLVQVGEDAIIEDDVTLHGGVFIGDRARIGKATCLHPGVVIQHDCTVGERVIIHAGTVVGSDGFGFVRDGASHVKIPQIGHVRIDDDVEIGANCTIDRAALGKTWIQRGAKIDNLVQIAHNVIIGENTIIVAQAGISGSVSVGRDAVIGGQVGIVDHISIGDRAMIGSQSGVAKSLETGEIVSGSPAIPHRLWLRTSSLTARLPKMNDRIKALEKKLEALDPSIKK